MKTMDTGMGETKQLCTFLLDGHLFGVDVHHVQEVIRYQEMTRVPLAPKVVSGLINLRGQIVTALDLRARFGMPPADAELLPTNIVLRLPDGVVSLLVDEIGDVLEVDEAALEPAPETLSATERTLITGVYKLPSCLVLLVDPRVATDVEAA